MSFIYDLQATWNDVNTVYNGIAIDVSNGAGGSPVAHEDSRILNLLQDGDSVFNVNVDGETSLLNLLFIQDGSDDIAIGRDDDDLLFEGVVGSYIFDAPVVSPSIRQKVTGNLNVYVATNGNNTTNTGLSIGSPFLTPQHAADVLHEDYDLSGFAGIVNVANGIYTEGITYTYPTIGQVQIEVIGNIASPSSCVIDVGVGQTCFFAKDGGVMNIQGFKLQGGSGSIGLHAGQFGIVDFSDMEFGAHPGGIQILIGQLGSMNCLGNYTITGDAAVHLALSHGGNGDFQNATAVQIPNARAFTTFVEIVYGGNLNAATYAFTGAGVAGTTGKRWTSSIGSAIQANGRDLDTVFPGNARGSQLLSNVDSSEDIIVRENSLATNVNKGFFFIPFMSGAPIGTPVPNAGSTAMVLDVTNNKIWCYYGAAWHFTLLT